MKTKCKDRVVRAGCHFGAPLLLVAVSVALFFVPGALETLRYDRAAVAAGEGWRIVTSQFVHAGTEHLAWDVAATLALGLAVAARSVRRFLLIVGASALAIPLAVHAALPGLDTFCGLSGIASALFASYAVTTVAAGVRDRRWGLVVTTSIVGAAFAAKLAFEATTGAAVFVDLDANSLVPVPMAHLLGAAIGVVFTVPRSGSAPLAASGARRPALLPPAGRVPRRALFVFLLSFFFRSSI